MDRFSIKYILFGIILIGNMIACTNNTTSIDSGKEITLRLEPKKGNPRNSEGDFIQLKDGNILFVYTHFTEGAADNASAYLAGRISKDGGITWDKEDIIILPNEGSLNIMSVSLLRLQSGEIALFYLRKNSETDCIPFMRLSTDEAKTWGEPKRCIPSEGYYVVNNDRFVQLPGGRIIFPTSKHEGPDWKHGKIFTFYSDDKGETWHKSNLVANPKNIVLQEPGIIALKDHKIMLFCRTESGVQYLSYSNDRGETWSEIEPGNIRSPLSPASIERIPSTGDLLLLWNDNYTKGRDGGKRTPYSLAISRNEGKTWEKIKTVESDPAGWYCYTAIDFTKDHVLLGHCAGDTRTNNGLSTIQITRLSLDWIYKDATADPKAVEEEKRVLLTCEDKNARIRYTLDGSLPSSSTGLIYQNPIIIDQLKPLYMQAFQTGKTPSKIVYTQIGSHIFQDAQQVDSTLKQGIYYQFFKGAFNHTSEIDKSQVAQTGFIPNISIQSSDLDTNFAFIFEGYIKIPKDGLYRFFLRSNDGSVLYLNEQKLIDNDGAHGSFEKSAATSLKKGFHKIKVTYFQAGGGKSLRVSWKSTDFDKLEIPASVLYHSSEKK